MVKFYVTYEIVTEESAEHGDCAERGFVTPGQWKGPEAEAMTLREAVNLIGCTENSGRWFTETDGRQDYITGACESRSLHPPENITPASYDRLARLLNA